MKKILAGVCLAAGVWIGTAVIAAEAADLKIALIYSKTGPLEAYAKQTEAGLMLGLEYLTGGTMMLDGRKIVVLPKDDQGKPDVAKSLLEQAYTDDGVDLAIGTSSSGATIAMLPVAEDAKKILLVEPAVADSITGDKWNRYIFRSARNFIPGCALRRASRSARATSRSRTLAQDYAFGHDGVAAFKAALAASHSESKVVFEEYAPFMTTDFTASAQRLFDALKDRPGRKIIAVIWAGPNPAVKLADMKPERYGIALAPGGNILPVMQQWKQLAGAAGHDLLLLRLPQEPDERLARGRAREALPHAARLLHLRRHGGGKRGCRRDQKSRRHRYREADRGHGGHGVRHPKGKMTFRKEDHQALQSMYVFKIKADRKNDWDLLDLVREIPASEIPVPIRNKR